MDFTQSMDNGYIIPTSVAVGSGEATDIRCVCDTVEDFKTFLDATEMDLRYEGLITYEKVNKLLKVYKGNDTWQTVGEGGGGVDTSSFITLTQLSQQLSNYYTKAQTDNKISEEIAKAQLGGGSEVDLSSYATIDYVDSKVISLSDKIDNFGKYEVPNLSGIVLENAEDPLYVPTYDGSDQLVHSKVLYFQNAWNGYKFWMAFTPLPYYPSVNENLENPSIAVSNDGENWIVPEGLTNPLDNITNLNKEYNSDTHLVYNPNTDELEIWYRHYLKETKVETIYKKVSKDGINWGDRIKIMNSDNGSDNHLLSPVVIFDQDKYKLWFINYTSKSMPYYESIDGVNFSKIADIKFNIDTLWHHDIIKSDGKYLLVASLFDRQSCIYSESKDGVNWTDCTTILTTTGKSSSKWDSEHLYRPSLTEVDGNYYFYYTGRDDDKTGAKQGLIKINGTNGIVVDANLIMQNNNRNFVTKQQIQDIANCKNNISILTELINSLSERVSALEDGGSVLDEIISITLTPKTYTFTSIGEKLAINKTFNPNSNINKKIAWESSDDTVASVDNLGIVTAKKNGNCIITATTVNGKSDTCSIVVSAISEEDSENVLYNLTGEFKGDGLSKYLDTKVKLYDSEKDWTVLVKYSLDGSVTTHPNAYIILSCWKESSPVNGFQLRSLKSDNSCILLVGDSSKTIKASNITYESYGLMAIKKEGNSYGIYGCTGERVDTITRSSNTVFNNSLYAGCTTDSSNAPQFYCDNTIKNLIVFNTALSDFEIKEKMLGIK